MRAGAGSTYVTRTQLTRHLAVLLTGRQARSQLGEGWFAPAVIQAASGSSGSGFRTRGADGMDAHCDEQVGGYRLADATQPSEAAS